MKKHLWFLGLAFGLLPSVIFAEVAQAVSLGLNPTTRNVSVGNQFEVDITISDLGNFQAPSVSTFDLDVIFDSNVLSFNKANFGDPVLGDQLDISFGSFTGVTPGSGKTNIFELSFDFPGVLNTSQPESFTLATLTFDAVQQGTSELELQVNALGDALGISIPVVEPIGNVTVKKTQIPEPFPEPLTLLGTATVFGFATSLKKQYSKNQNKFQ